MAQTAMKHSGQREAIRAYLLSTKSHPTAEMVYESVREAYPKISLGTVYRNLTLLVELGEAKKVASVDGQDRFDADMSPHYHLICRQCNAVEDLMLPVEEGLLREAKAGYAGEIESCEVLFYGSCEQCKKGNRA